MRDVAIVGAGMTSFGELWDASLRDLFVDAALLALHDAGAERVDSIYVGNMSAGQFVGQEHIGPLLADQLGMRGVPAVRVESACASGGAALRMGFLEVASGVSDIVLLVGVEKMTDGGDPTNVLATAADQEAEVYHGVTFPGLYAMIARAHMQTRGTTEEDLHWVAVKNHRHGALNPKAQFRREITVDDVAKIVAGGRAAAPVALLAGQRWRRRSTAGAAGARGRGVSRDRLNELSSPGGQRALPRYVQARDNRTIAGWR